MAVAIVLCGPPGCGKTTFRESLPSFPVLSTDDIILEWAKAEGKTYEEVWKERITEAERLFYQRMTEYQTDVRSFIVDRTNLSSTSRNRTMAFLNQGNGVSFKKVAIYFPCYTVEVLKARLDKRAEQGGHTVPFHALKQMHGSYINPAYLEGWDLICSTDMFTKIMGVASDLGTIPETDKSAS